MALLPWHWTGDIYRTRDAPTPHLLARSRVQTSTKLFQVLPRAIFLKTALVIRVCTAEPEDWLSVGAWADSDVRLGVLTRTRVEPGWGEMLAGQIIARQAIVRRAFPGQPRLGAGR